MLFVSMIAAMIGASPTIPQPQVRMTSDDRWTLVHGLKRQIGGPFILTGIIRGEGTCRSVRACVTPADLRSDPTVKNAQSVDQMLAAADVFGETPVAVVAVRGVRQVTMHDVQVLMSIYDVRTGMWTDRTGSFMTLAAGLPDGASSRALSTLRDTPGF